MMRFALKAKLEGNFRLIGNLMLSVGYELK
jgi:hypothetical protein